MQRSKQSNQRVMLGNFGWQAQSTDRLRKTEKPSSIWYHQTSYQTSPRVNWTVTKTSVDPAKGPQDRTMMFVENETAPRSPMKS